MRKVLAFIVIVTFFTSCAATFCPGERTGKQGASKDPVIKERRKGTGIDDTTVIR